MKRLLALFVLIVASAAAHAEAPVILVFGDSISAGYGLAPEQGWVELLKTRLKSQGYGYQVVNASVSGETTAGGLARLPRALELHHPSIVILELGGNDGLRALPIAQMRANLTQMANLSSAAGAKVLLLGMRMPPNYGPEYTQQFAMVFSDLAAREETALGALPTDRHRSFPGPAARRRHSSQRSRPAYPSRECLADLEAAAA